MITREELEEYKTNYYIFKQYKEITEISLILTIACLIIAMIAFFTSWKVGLTLTILSVLGFGIFIYSGSEMLKYNEKLYVFEHTKLGMTDNVLP